MGANVTRSLDLENMSVSEVLKFAGSNKHFPALLQETITEYNIDGAKLLKLQSLLNQSKRTKTQSVIVPEEETAEDKENGARVVGPTKRTSAERSAEKASKSAMRKSSTSNIVKKRKLSTPSGKRTPLNQVKEDEEIWEIEKILAVRMFGKTKKWLVKWVGYGSDDNTWEPRSSFLDNTMIKEFEETSTRRDALANSNNLKALESVKAKYGLFPLHEAAECGALDDATILIREKGVDVDLRDDDGMTAISYAAMWNHDSVLNLLHLVGGASLNVQDNDGDTPVIQAAYNNSPDALELLISFGADTSVKNKDGKCALQYALDKQYIKCATILKTHLRKKSVLEDESVTPFTTSAMFACDNKKVRAVKMEYGAFPLHKSCGAGLMEEVKILIASGLNVEEKNGFGWSPLYYASSRNHPDVMKVLKEAGASLEDVMSHSGDTLAMVAAENDCPESMAYLIQEGIDISKCNKNGDSALHCAAKYNTKETVAIVHMLRKAGICLDTKNKDGVTPAMWAAKYGSSKVLRVLLQHKANFELKSKDGKTALDFALAREGNPEGSDHDKCEKLLRLYISDKAGGHTVSTQNSQQVERRTRSRRTSTRSLR
jgi:ankyrin repeat protein